MHWRFFIFVCLLTTLGGSGANAAVTNPFRVANWSGGSYSNDQSKQFEHCTASFTNPAGIVISYSINRQYQWRLAFSNPSWSFIEGYSQTTLLRLGERNYLRGRVIVMDGRTLEVQTGDALSLFAALWTASRLQVTAGGLKFEFELISSGEVLSALVQCALRQTGLSRRANAGRLGVMIGPNARDEAKAIATGILAYGRIVDFKMLAPSEAPGGEQAAAAWKTGFVTSSIDILGPSGTTKVEDVSIRIVEVDVRKCRSGFFFAWALEEIDQSEIARTFTSCQTPEATTFVYYITAPRPKGGFYLLSSRTSGSGFGGVVQQQLEEMDAKLRATLMVAVNKVEQADSEPTRNAEPSEEASALDRLDRLPGRD